MTEVLTLIKLTGDRLRFCWRVMVSAMVGAMDVIGVGLILPFATLILIPNHPTLLKVLDRVFGITDVSQALITQVGIGLFATFILKNIFSVFAVRGMTRFSCEGTAKIAKRLLFLYFNAPLEYYADRNSADIIRSLQVFAPRCYEDGVLGLCSLLGEGASFILMILLLFLLAPLAMTLAAVVLFTLLALNHIVVGRRMYRWSQLSAKIFSLSHKHMAQIFPVMKEIRTLGRTHHFIDRIVTVLQDSAELRRKQQFAAQMARPVTETFMLLAILVVLSTLLSGDQTIVDALPTIAVFAAATIRLLPLVNRLSTLYNRFKGSKLAVETIVRELKEAELVEKKVSNCGVNAPPEFEHSLELCNVGYHYPSATDGALNGVTLTLKKGELVGLVGPSGSGKSTLADIILGLIKPTAGKILVDGEDFSSVTSKRSSTVAYVPQETLIFDDTLRRNIAFCLKDTEISEDRVLQVVKDANLDSVVRHLEKGLDSKLGERGHKISGGERQRVGIARALYNTPDLLVLDEVTSGLDGQTEQDITRSIASLKGQATVVLIAHRLHTLKACDRIFFLKEGRIIAEGDYDKLLLSCPEFSRLAELADTGTNQPSPESAESIARANMDREI
jgi:ATP-binding cassette subfamily C protein